MKIISLGAGVQSSTMFLMSCMGELDRVDAAIFADTQDEPQSVYRYLEWLEKKGREYGIPIYRVTVGRLSDEFIDKQQGSRKSGINIPVYCKDQEGNVSIAGRQCTRAYKIAPVRRKARELMIAKGDSTIDMWIGISVDEIARMKQSPVKYITHRWPLIDNRMSRSDCRAWFESINGPQPPRSACLYCPFKNQAEWQSLKSDEPEEFRRAVKFDRLIRTHHGRPGREFFVHKSMLPLDEAVESTSGQHDFGFINECEGMCGV